MKARVIKKFEKCDNFETTRNVVLPAPALCAVNEQLLHFLDENQIDDIYSVNVRIGQPNVVNSTIEFDIFIN